MNHGTTERKRQMAFRNTSLTVSDEGRSPADAKGQRNGHLLALCHEDENLIPSLRKGVAKQFFADRHIHWWRSARSGDDVAQDGPTRNMASSQIACVNFLLPLASGDQGPLVDLLRGIDSDVCSVLPLEYSSCGAKVATPSPVEFEWVGIDSCLEGGQGTRGANTTSVDALVVGVTNKGVLRAYLFEWKYVEEYKDAEYLGDGKSGETRRRRYAGLYAAPDSRFNGQVPMDDLLYEPFYQIMRLGLLGDKMLRDKEFGVSEAKVVVVCPAGNTAYRDTLTSPPMKQRFPAAATVETVIKAAHHTPEHFVMTSPEALVAAVSNGQVSSKLTEWLAYQHERYGYK